MDKVWAEESELPGARKLPFGERTVHLRVRDDRIHDRMDGPPANPAAADGSGPYRPNGALRPSLSQLPDMRDNAKRADGVRSPCEKGSVMQEARSGAEDGIESELVDLGGVSLIRLRTLGGGEMRRALQHAVDRVAHIQVTASGSSGSAKRVD
ncbi:hypothetical protein [Amycolatopsis sp. lyj-346]|uniref:hypothetical protein n=1 Tax=Amycolatopsis sp. lyj-346 TaxID=2789289 RepID=UPI0039797FB2